MVIFHCYVSLPEGTPLELRGHLICRQTHIAMDQCTPGDPALKKTAGNRPVMLVAVFMRPDTSPNQLLNMLLQLHPS